MEHEYWNSVFQNAIGCSIGSLVAIIISLVIYQLTLKENTKTLRTLKPLLGLTLAYHT